MIQWKEEEAKYCVKLWQFCSFVGVAWKLWTGGGIEALSFTFSITLGAEKTPSQVTLIFLDSQTTT